MKKIIVYVIKAICFVFFMGCTHKQRLIGFIGAPTGKYGDLSTEGRNGFLLAVEEFNKSSKYKVQPIEYNLKQDPIEAQRQMVEAAKRGVNVIIGPMTSAMAVAVAPKANEHKILFISPTSGTNQLAGLNDFHFRVYPTTSELGDQLAKKVFTEGIRRVSVVYDNSNKSYSEIWAESFEKSFVAAGGQVLGRHAFHTKEVKFLEIAQKIKSENAEGVVIVAQASDTGLFCQQLKKLNLILKLYGTEWAATKDLFLFGGKSVEGLKFLSTYNYQFDSEKFKEFVKKYKLRFSEEPSFASLHAFDTTNIVLSYFPDFKNGEDLKLKILKQKKHRVLQGDLMLDENGDINRTLYVGIVKEGKFKIE